MPSSTEIRETFIKKGIKLINKIIKQTGTFTGEDMGKLYETFGFPSILTKEICESKGFIMDIN